MVFTLTLTTAADSSSCSCSTSMGCGNGMKKDSFGEGCGQQGARGRKGLRVGEKNGEMEGKKCVGDCSVRRCDDASNNKCVRSVTAGGTNKVHRKTYSGVPRKTYTKLQATLGLFICALHLISCAAAGSPLNIWNYLPLQKRSLLSQDKIKRFAPPSRVSDYWTFVSHVAPSFDNSHPKNMTTQLGQTVYLHCVVNNLGDKTVSWIRRRDFHVLTVGLDTYTTDDRFEAIHMERNNDWTLKIKFAHLKDAGLYECQVSSDPKISLFVNLSVVVAKADILGPHPLFVKTGSSINLTCVITKSPEPPVFVFWYHDDRMINYDSSRGEIAIQKTAGDSAVSRLYIKDAQADDSGNYTCCPSNTEATSISVYVLNGERPAAIQHDANISRSSSTTPRFSVCILLVLSAFITR